MSCRYLWWSLSGWNRSTEQPQWYKNNIYSTTVSTTRFWYQLDSCSTTILSVWTWHIPLSLLKTKQDIYIWCTPLSFDYAIVFVVQGLNGYLNFLWEDPGVQEHKSSQNKSIGWPQWYNNEFDSTTVYSSKSQYQLDCHSTEHFDMTYSALLAQELSEIQISDAHTWLVIMT